MASTLHQSGSTPTDYAAGVPAQLVFAGLLVIPVVIAGYVRLWRTAELRFLAVTCTLLVIYVVVWVPGRQYYAQGTVAVVVAAGSVAAEGWAARARPARRRLRTGILVAAPVVGMAVLLPAVLPIVPVADLHDVPAQDKVSTADTVGWPQLTRTVAAQDAALVRAGQPPTSIFTDNYGEAAALDVLGSGYHLPPVLSGHNAFWMWGPGRASDRTVLFVDSLSWLQPYFAHCRVLSTYDVPYHVHNDFTDLQIGVCTGPVARWRGIWPHLKHYN
jgi:hypothetical protein